MIVALAGYLACGLFISVLYYPHFWYLMAFAIVIDRLSRQLPDPQPAAGG